MRSYIRPPIHPVFPPKMSTLVMGVSSDMIAEEVGKTRDERDNRIGFVEFVTKKVLCQYIT